MLRKYRFEKSLYDLIKGLRSHKGAEEDYIHPIHRSICPRTETVEGLSQLLDEYKVIHVRGAPASGKTTLAKLLERYLRGRRRVVYIPSWKTDNLSATRFLEQENHKSGYTHDRNLLLSGGTDDIVFIIDDVQKTYSGSGLWYSVIKSRVGLHHSPRFCLFSSYGHPLFGSPSLLTILLVLLQQLATVQHTRTYP